MVCGGSRRPEGIIFSLLWREDIVPVQVSAKPYESNNGKCDKACSVIDYIDKGQQYGYPPGEIVNRHDQPVSPALFD